MNASGIELMRPEPRDIPQLGRICYEAFRHISESHGFERDFSDVATATQVVSLLVDLPGSFGVAARIDGRLAGSNFMLLTDQVAGVGPITVDPACQGRGIGRRLMVAALDYARERGFDRVRLVQDSYNTTSLSLYASLGFEVREPLGAMAVATGWAADATIRLAQSGDLEALEQLSIRHYRISRRNELAAWFRLNFPVLLREQSGRLSGYLVPGKIGHGVAETEADALALIAQIPRYSPPQLAMFFCPLRNASLYRATLRAGCRLTKIMNLMTLGPYEKPEPIWFPSIAY